MNAVLATLLGTLAGAIATIGAATATGWAQREGARIAARANHRTERRQPRHDAYAAVLKAAMAIRERVDLESYEDTSPEEEERLMEGISNGWLELSLLGPPSAVISASGLRTTAHDIVVLMRKARVLGQRFLESDEDDEVAFEAAERAYSTTVDTIANSAIRLQETITKFALAASAALDEDGTESRRFMRRSPTA
ncbi:hypothetical protein [Streptomyces atratus]|uniref:hypothetical protein n=1 Tax=Streptomyces atratus TaxID=1893 RepID=UPI0032555F34